MNDIYKIIKDLNERDKRVAKAQGIEEVRKKVASFIKTEHRKTSSNPVKKILFQLAEELELT